jgi:transposase
MLIKSLAEADAFPRAARRATYNNIVECALKKAILNRKNALFYRTLNGAGVGDLFMSLIYTCELNGANPFDYLTELQRHAGELPPNPSQWTPWNYRETLASRASPTAAQYDPGWPGRRGSTAAMLG